MSSDRDARMAPLTRRVRTPKIAVTIWGWHGLDLGAFGVSGLARLSGGENGPRPLARSRGARESLWRSTAVLISQRRNPCGTPRRSSHGVVIGVWIGLDAQPAIPRCGTVGRTVGTRVAVLLSVV
jgi:hypothetical protein